MTVRRVMTPNGYRLSEVIHGGEQRVFTALTLLHYPPPVKQLIGARTACPQR